MRETYTPTTLATRQILGTTVLITRTPGHVWIAPLPIVDLPTFQEILQEALRLESAGGLTLKPAIPTRHVAQEEREDTPVWYDAFRTGPVDPGTSEVRG